jgi:hypothetical protein
MSRIGFSGYVCAFAAVAHRIQQAAAVARDQRVAVSIGMLASELFKMTDCFVALFELAERG